MSYPVEYVLGIFRAFISGHWLWKMLFLASEVLTVGAAAGSATPRGRALLTEWGFPDIGPWQFGTVASVIGMLFFAARISSIETRRLRVVELDRQPFGEGWRIRATIKNISSRDAYSLRVTLDQIREMHPLVMPKCSFPLVLTTAQRLQRAEQLSQEIPTGRFKLFSKEIKQIELFSLDSVQIIINHENGVESPILGNGIFDFSVYGFGEPEKFSVLVFDYDGSTVGTFLLRDDTDLRALKQLSLEELAKTQCSRAGESH